MEELKIIIEFCTVLGTILLGVGLVVSGIIRWLQTNDSNTRKKRFNIISWIAFIVLCAMLLVRFEVAELQIINSNVIVIIFLNILRNVTGLLIFGSVVFSVIVLFLVVIFFLYHNLQIILQASKGNNIQIDTSFKDAIKGSDNFVSIIRAPIIRVFIAWAILALFFILPFILGERTSSSPIEIWQNGIDNIVRLFNMQPASGAESFKSLLSYILIYIIVLGVGFAVIKLLYSIIGHILEKKTDKEILDEYSGSIALLAIGVALLWTFQGDDHTEVILNLFKSFGTVLIIAAVMILTLEIIRLLMDLKEKLIRQEAKYLFIFLIGQVTLLLLSVLNSVFDAVNGIISSTDNSKMDEVVKLLTDKVVETIRKEIENTDIKKEQKDNEKNGMTFSPFNEKTTKK